MDARLRYVAVALAFIVELLYLWIAAEALLFWPVHGVFFAMLAIGYGLLSINLLYDPGRWTFRLGILFNGGILVLWTIVRAIELVFPVWILDVRTPVDGIGSIVFVLVFVLIVLLISGRTSAS